MGNPSNHASRCCGVASIAASKASSRLASQPDGNGRSSGSAARPYSRSSLRNGNSSACLRSSEATATRYCPVQHAVQ